MFRRKKALLMFLGALALLLALAPLAAFAEEAGVSTNQVSATGGGEVSFSVQVGDIPESFATLEIVFSYDHDKLSIDKDGVSFRSGLAGSTEFYEQASSGSMYAGLVNGTNAISLTGSASNVCTLTFKVNGTAAATSTYVQVASVRCLKVNAVVRANGAQDYQIETVAEVSLDERVTVSIAPGGVYQSPSPTPSATAKPSTSPAAAGEGGNGAGTGAGDTAAPGQTQPPSGGGTATTPPTTDLGGGTQIIGGTRQSNGTVSVGLGTTATIVLPDGRQITVPGGTDIVPDASAPGGYTLVFHNPFTDVKESDWFYDDVAFVYTRGLFLGMDQTTFSPLTNVTRGQIITVLGRLHGVDASKYTTSSFTDVAVGAYYAPYVEWGRQNGVVQGIGGGLYAPDRQILRQELVTIFSRYAKEVAKKTLPVTRADNTFADEDQIDAYAVDPIHELYQSGMFNGLDGNICAPKNVATRAQAAAIIHRLAVALELIN
jgi:hypothetical protein